MHLLRPHARLSPKFDVEGTVPLLANEKGSKDEIDKKMSLYIILSSIYILLL